MGYINPLYGGWWNHHLVLFCVLKEVFEFSNFYPHLWHGPSYMTDNLSNESPGSLYKVTKVTRAKKVWFQGPFFFKSEFFWVKHSNIQNFHQKQNPTSDQTSASTILYLNQKRRELEMEEPLHFKNFPLNNEALQIYLLEFLFSGKKNKNRAPTLAKGSGCFSCESHNPNFQWASHFFSEKKTEDWFVEFTISPLPLLMKEILQLLPLSGS